MTKQTREAKADEELVRIVMEAKDSTTNGFFHQPEITAALINYRAAQLVSGWLATIAENLSNIEVNIRNRS